MSGALVAAVAAAAGALVGAAGDAAPHAASTIAVAILNGIILRAFIVFSPPEKAGRLDTLNCNLNFFFHFKPTLLP